MRPNQPPQQPFGWQLPQNHPFGASAQYLSAGAPVQQQIPMIDPMQFVGNPSFGQPMGFPPGFPQMSNRGLLDYGYPFLPQMMQGMPSPMQQFAAQPQAPPAQYSQPGQFDSLYNSVANCDQNGNADTNSNPELRKHFPFMKDSDHIVIKVFLNPAPFQQPSFAPEQFMPPQGPYFSPYGFQMPQFQFMPPPGEPQRLQQDPRLNYGGFGSLPGMTVQPELQVPEVVAPRPAPPQQQNWGHYITPSALPRPAFNGVDKNSKEIKEIFENRILNDQKSIKVEQVLPEEPRPKPVPEPPKKELRTVEAKEPGFSHVVPAPEAPPKTERPPEPAPKAIFVPPPVKREVPPPEPEKPAAPIERRPAPPVVAPAPAVVVTAPVGRPSPSETLKVSDKEPLKTKDLTAAAYVLSKKRMNDALVFAGQQSVNSSKRTKKIQKLNLKKTGPSVYQSKKARAPLRSLAAVVRQPLAPKMPPPPSGPTFKIASEAAPLVPRHLEKVLVPIFSFGPPKENGASKRMVPEIRMNPIRLQVTGPAIMNPREDLLSRVRAMNLNKLRVFWEERGAVVPDAFRRVGPLHKRKAPGPETVPPEITDYSGKIIQNGQDGEDGPEMKSGDFEGHSDS